MKKYLYEIYASIYIKSLNTLKDIKIKTYSNYDTAIKDFDIMMLKSHPVYLVEIGETSTHLIDKTPQCILQWEKTEKEEE